jgi:hypothetical protein
MQVSAPYPTVSVVIPTYNRARTVTKSIESILRQSHPNYEIVVVDDGSTDNTPAVLERYRGQITYIRQENQGRSSARNHGLHSVSNPYVVFLDSDDVLLPNMLAVQTAYLERHPRAAFVYGCGLMADLDGNIVKPPVLMGAPLEPDQPAFASLVMGTPIMIHTAVIRRTCLQAVGDFDETLSGNEDWDMWLRLAASYEVGFNPEPVAVYSVSVVDYPSRLNHYQMQQTIPQMIERAFRYLPPDSPLLALKPRAVARARVEWGACLEYALGHGQRVVAHLQEALTMYPALLSDIEVVPRGVAQFATWHQTDGAAFIRAFFHDLTQEATALKGMERTTLALYHSKQSQLAAFRRNYATAANHALRAALAQPWALGWAAARFARRLCDQQKQ